MNYPTAQHIRNSLKKARLTETELSVEHVEMLLNVLVLDGKIERVGSLPENDVFFLMIRRCTSFLHSGRQYWTH